MIALNLNKGNWNMRRTSEVHRTIKTMVTNCEENMDRIQRYEEHLPADLKKVFRSLDTPRTIQDYLDSIPYRAEELDRSPLRVMRDGQAHCLDGGYFAALALSRIGFPPLVVDLVPEPELDDDHVLAVFKVDGRWGALAKSNFVGLGYREPVFLNLRELVMSYFENYFNIEKDKTLRGYRRPLNLAQFDSIPWMWDEEAVKIVNTRLYALKVIPVITPKMVKRLSMVDERTFKGGTVGIDFSWTYGNRGDEEIKKK